MSTNGTKIKKEPKATNLPKPIKVKKEEDRTLHTMEHYIDDRLELVKQIFGTLKPKTITNLAPEFLKPKSMEELEELCLEELLCLSTKRLKSVINATKCPTDTESSDDSDVERHEEHVSLEEISSDSEIEGGKTKKKSSANKNDAKKSKKTKTGKPDNSHENDDEEEDGQISVLELLELQARARAIRSQLALEPVTKVELNSDNENAEASEKTPKTKETKSKEKKSNKNSVEQQKQLDAETTQGENRISSPIPNASKEKQFNTKVRDSEQEPEHKTESRKAIKLKRNFRKTNKTDDNSASDEIDLTKAYQTGAVTKREVRSNSPDVITIVPEPETLLISSSDDEQNPEKTGRKRKQSAKELKTVPAEQPKKPKEPEEIEEGEITDNDTEANNTEVTDNLESNNTTDKVLELDNTTEGTIHDESASATVNDDDDDDDDNKDNSMQPTSPQDVSNELNATSSTDHETEADTSANITDSDNQNGKLNENNSQMNAKSVENSMTLIVQEENALEDDAPNDDDDIISIEGGDLTADLGDDSDDSRLSHHNNSNDDSQKEKMNDRENSDTVISLNSSEDENSKFESESWQSRYMKSSKVNKVLAASRLCKRVRDKLKTSKRASKSTVEKDDEVVKKPKIVFNSKHEEGSLEQYKELLELSRTK